MSRDLNKVREPAMLTRKGKHSRQGIGECQHPEVGSARPITFQMQQGDQYGWGGVSWGESGDAWRTALEGEPVGVNVSVSSVTVEEGVMWMVGGHGEGWTDWPKSLMQIKASALPFCPRVPGGSMQISTPKTLAAWDT